MNRAAHLLIAVLLVAVVPAGAQEAGVLHGFVREVQDREAVGLARVSVGAGERAATSGRDGYFSLPHLAAGSHRVRVVAPGFEALDTLLQVRAGTSVPVELRLRRAAVPIEGLVVTGESGSERPFHVPEVSVQTLTPEVIRRVPAALEADIFRSLQALPGVISPGVLSSRLLVRGGAADQNLFLLDGYPVLYPYHLAGAFSTFHIDAVRDAEFWIGAPPARYGGRLSSVLDVGLREGDRERLTGAASLGLVTSSAVVEGPHPGGAWFVGARRTYIDQIARGGENGVPYHFYDAYAKTYIDLTPSDRVSGLVFLGRDATWKGGSREEHHFHWANDVYGLSWRHLFGGLAVFEQRVSLSRFTQELRGGASQLLDTQIETDHSTQLAAVQGELRVTAWSAHDLRLGYSVERQEDEHRTAYLPFELGHAPAERKGRAASTTRALYAQDDFALGGDLRVRLGLRGEESGAYRSLQPRVAAKYLVSDRVALTAGAGVLRQYSHLLQDPDVNFDVYNADIWLSAHEAGVSAGRSTHLIGGVEARLREHVRFRAEGYSKSFGGLVTLAPYDPVTRQPAVLRLEDASGSARGLDLSLSRERAGPLRGWVGYSLASSRREVEGYGFAADPHPRHRFVAVAEQKPEDDWSWSGRFEVFQGVPFTPAVGMVPDRPFDFALGRFTSLCAATTMEYVYGDRNSARTGWSKRLDLGAGRRWKDRRGRRWEASFSLLNALFDPTGIFRPAPAKRQNGCDTPAKVVREPEFVLPPIPSAAIRVEF